MFRAVTAAFLKILRCFFSVFYGKYRYHLRLLLPCRARLGRNARQSAHFSFVKLPPLALRQHTQLNARNFGSFKPYDLKFHRFAHSSYLAVSGLGYNKNKHGSVGLALGNKAVARKGLLSVKHNALFHFKQIFLARISFYGNAIGFIYVGRWVCKPVCKLAVVRH